MSEAVRSAERSPEASPRAAACSTTPSARATRTRSASRRSTCSSTRRRSTSSSTSTPCSPRSPGSEFEARINSELMQSVLEITTPVCRTAADVEQRAAQLRSLRDRGRRASRASASARRARTRSASSSASGSRRRTATAALVDQMQYIARRELIFGMHVHVAVDGPEKAIQVVNGAARPPPQLLALSASSPFWRGEPTGLASQPADGLRGVPALGPAAALPRLRRLRGGRRPARAHRLHRRLHAHLVGHPPAPAARHGRDPHLRRGHAARGRGRDRRVLPVARQALLGAVRRRRGDPVATTGS